MPFSSRCLPCGRAMILRDVTFKVFSPTVHSVHRVYLTLSATAEEERFLILLYFSGILNEVALRPSRMYIALSFFTSMNAISLQAAFCGGEPCRRRYQKY